MRKTLLSALLSSAIVCFGRCALADCPLFNMSKGADRAAHILLTSPGLTRLFLGTIESEKFVGDFRRRYDMDANNSVDITYHVDEVYSGQASSTLTLRTPFFCEACSYDSKAELQNGLDSDIGRRVIVFQWEEVAGDGHRETHVSGGCPDSIDAPRLGSKEDELVLALRRATHKN